jgi:predicted Fe-Mo cluster-binding NifX family protein
MLERARRAIALGIEKRAPMYLDASEDLVLAPPEAYAPRPFHFKDKVHSECMAVACSGIELTAPVERIFGRAPAFALISPNNAIVQIENPGSRAKRKAAQIAVKALQTHNASRVVAGRFGPEAIQALAVAGIQPLVANGFNLEQSIDLLKKTHPVNT